jgi:hypothetical protein
MVDLFICFFSYLSKKATIVVTSESSGGRSLE